MNAETAANIRVLVIDDDRKLCRLIEEYLSPMGYQVHMVHDGAEGLTEALSGRHHVVILDVMMPRMDGFEVLRRLRKESEIPVLMLTARGEETDRIVGLEIGADDYLPKTFSARELLARLRSVTRRSLEMGKTAVPKVQSPVVVGDLRVEPSSRAAFLRGEAMVLTPIEFDLLAVLAAAAGRVLTRDQLLDAVAGREYEVFDRSVDVHISSIRKKLGDDPRRPRFIKTVRSAGYLFLDEPEQA